MSEPSGPTYNLETVKALVAMGQYSVTLAATNGLGELGFDRKDLEACISELTASDFHKTMPAEQVAGLWQDVYKPEYCGQLVYLKVQITLVRGASQKVVVISFKDKYKRT